MRTREEVDANLLHSIIKRNFDRTLYSVGKLIERHTGRHVERWSKKVEYIVSDILYHLSK